MELKVELNKFSLCIGLVAGAVMALPQSAHGFAYIFAGESNGIDVVTHPIGYNGGGGTVTVTVGIDSTSVNAAAMEISTQNVVILWNQLNATTGNIDFAPFSTGEVLLDRNGGTVAGGPGVSPTPPAANGGDGNSLTSVLFDGPGLFNADQTPGPVSSSGNPGPSQADFESTLLHEVGHSLGLAHVNAATESGLTGNNRNYTKATDGLNNVFDINPGADGVIGSADDIRGDDVNLNYFFKSSNDPFNPSNVSGVVDSTTFSRDVADLPVGDLFSANADRAVAALLGYTAGDGTEAVMQQGAFFGENQRTLVADDVAGLLYAQSGLDNIAGTADDYTLVLQYIGQTTAADILIDFDDSETGFAVSESSGRFLSSDDVAITGNRIYFNSESNFFFNDVLIPEPGSALALLVVGSLGLARRRRA